MHSRKLPSCFFWKKTGAQNGALEDLTPASKSYFSCFLNSSSSIGAIRQTNPAKAGLARLAPTRSCGPGGNTFGSSWGIIPSPFIKYLFYFSRDRLVR